MSPSDLKIPGEMDSSTGPVPKKEMILDLNNPGFWLVIWDIFFGLPISYAIAFLNKSFLTFLGYEKFMRCPSGIFVNRMLMVIVNLWLVVGWAVQLIEEQRREEREERIQLRAGEIEGWKGIVKELERERERCYELEQKQIEEQLTPRPADKRVIEIEERVDSMMRKNLAGGPVSPSKSKIPTPSRIKAQHKDDDNTPKANQHYPPPLSEAELAQKFNAQRAAMAKGKIIPGLWKV